MSRPSTARAAPPHIIPPGPPAINRTLLPYLHLTRKRHGRRPKKKNSTYTLRQTHFRPTTLPQNSPYFHQMITNRKPGSSCFLFQNVNGLPVMDSSSMRTALDFMQDSKVSFIGLQETKINTNYPTATPQIRKTFSSLMPGSKVHASSNNVFLSNSLHQHGGLLSATSRPFPVSTSHTSSDPTSCIQHTSILLGSCHLSIFNIYIPHTSLGPITNYTQAVIAMRKLRLCPPNKKPQIYIYETLLKKVTDAREQGHLIIIGGDFNEAFRPAHLYPSTTVNMSTTMTKLNLVLATNPDGEHTPPTHSKGKKTLDHIWMSSDLLPLLTGYGYLPFNTGFMSDH